jgi:hypothetical protein
MDIPATLPDLSKKLREQLQRGRDGRYRERVNDLSGC